MAPGHPTSPLCVLVLDDWKDSAISLALLVQLWGHEPLVAYDGPTALDLARTHPPDVALLDIGLRDGMDGCEVARRLRQLPGMDKALLLAVTGYGREEDVERCRDAGIDRHFVKPVVPEELRQVLARAEKLGWENSQLARQAGTGGPG